MGSLTSRPKVPVVPAAPVLTTQTPVAVPQTYITTTTPAPEPAPVTSPNTVETANVDDTERVPLTSDITRVENLLRRNRGIGGTVLTGFRGLLSRNELTPQRKALLGE